MPTVDLLNDILDASRDGDLKRVRSLLDAGANPDARDVLSGYTPLHRAVGGGNVELIELLLDAGADIEHSKNTVFITPLASAVFTRRTEVVRVLLARGADPNVGVWPDGQSLIDAARKESTEDVVELLEEYLQPRGPM